MPERFEPNRRLLKILVGSNLYGSPDACVRELIQNAWDAIQLRKTIGDGKGGKIDIRYSVNEGWFEIADDGIGMEMHSVKNSFLDIGQDKLDVLDMSSRDAQIGYFGIGILSIFLIADRFEVITRHFDRKNEGIRFEITGIDDYPEFLDQEDEPIGTRIKVFPKSDGSFSIQSLPASVGGYARHVTGITITSVDDNTQQQLSHTWVTENFDNVRQLENFPGVYSGRFAMNAALHKNTGTLSNQITICNAGFLAEEDTFDLIPAATFGFVGEIDLKPNTLTMGMSRERIQRDEKWKALGNNLQNWLIRFALDELHNGHLMPNENLDSDEVKRNLFLWYHFIPQDEPFSELYSTVESRIFETVPFKLADRGFSSLKNIFKKNPTTRKLFYRQIGRKNESIERIEDDGLPIRITREMKDSIRVGALRANGFDVVELGSFQVNVRKGNSVQTHQIEDQQIVNNCLRAHDLTLINITDAKDSDMDLHSLEKLPILNDALPVGNRLRFASVPDSMRRVITDSSGIKYINLRNKDIQEILKVVPQALSNPLKNRLLEAYLKLEDYQIHDARVLLTELLKSDDLISLAIADTAPFTQKYVDSLITNILLEIDK